MADFLKKYRSDTLTGRIYSPTGGLNDAFHGYIDGTYTLTKTQRLQPIAIEIISPSMDLKRSIGKRILYENYTIASILINLLLSAGVYLDNLFYLQITTYKLNEIVLPIFIAEEDEEFHEVLQTLLFEYGYGFYFINGFNAALFRVAPLFTLPGGNPPSLLTAQILMNKCRSSLAR